MGASKNANAASSQLAKLSPPKLINYFPRQRLLDELTRISNETSAIWIHAPAGYGKTSLCASFCLNSKRASVWYQVDSGDTDIASCFHYLSLFGHIEGAGLPAYSPALHSDVTVFSRVFFRALYQRLPPNAILVVDNVHEVLECCETFYTMLEVAINELPRSLTLFLMSRNPPPGKFVKLQTQNLLHVVREDQLALSTSECFGIAKARYPNRRFSNEEIQALSDYAHGWTAGLILLMENNVSDKYQPPRKTPKSIFDFFANEIFLKLDEKTQNVLIRTAYFPSFTSKMANDLCDHETSSILNQLFENNFFTVKNGYDSYSYHPLFIEFLKSCELCNRFNLDSLKLMKDAAEVMIANNQAASAVSLLLESHNWHESVSLILSVAPQCAQQGRLGLMRAWMHAIPADLISNNGWLEYWTGISQMGLDWQTARHHLTSAFRIFEKCNQIEQCCLTWNAIADSYMASWDNLHELDSWLNTYETFIRPQSPHINKAIYQKSLFAYLNASLSRRYVAPEQREIAEELEDIFWKELDTQQRIDCLAPLVTYWMWTEGVNKAKRFVSSTGDKPPQTMSLRINWLFANLFVATASAQTENCIRFAQEAIEFKEAHGIHMPIQTFIAYFTLAHGYLYQGRIDLAENTIAEAEQRFGEQLASVIGLYHNLKASILSHKGQYQSAFEHATLSFKHFSSPGYAYLKDPFQFVYSYTLAKAGQHEIALTELKQCIEQKLDSGRSMDRFCYFSLEAMIRLELKLEGLDTALKKALSVYERTGFAVLPGVTPESYTKLMAYALEHNIYSTYAIEIIHHLNLRPPSDHRLENWPWPVKIYTSGHLKIFIHDRELALKKKGQLRPLALLTHIAALGGKSVSATQLSEILWPDTDGDTAFQSLTSTLHRLRKLLNSDDCITLEGGHLSLNPTNVWLDLWEIESLFDALDSSLKEKNIDAVTKTFERLLNYYRDDLLTVDPSPWLIQPRLDLHSKVARYFTRLQKLLEGQCEYDLLLHYTQALLRRFPQDKSYMEAESKILACMPL